MSLNKLMNFNSEGLNLKIAMEELKVQGTATIGELKVNGEIISDELKVNSLVVGDLQYPTTDIIDGGNVITDGLNNLSIRNYPVQNSYGYARGVGSVLQSLGVFPDFTTIDLPFNAPNINLPTEYYTPVFPCSIRILQNGTYRISAYVSTTIALNGLANIFGFILDGSTLDYNQQTQQTSVPLSPVKFASTTYININANQVLSLGLSSTTAGNGATTGIISYDIERVK